MYVFTQAALSALAVSCRLLLGKVNKARKLTVYEATLVAPLAAFNVNVAKLHPRLASLLATHTVLVHGHDLGRLSQLLKKK